MCGVSDVRDRSAAFDDVEDYEAVPWNYKAIFGSFKGIPWWAAILCALVPAFIGAFIDISSSKTVGWTFIAVFFVGAVAGILLVQRRSLFAPKGGVRALVPVLQQGRAGGQRAGHAGQQARGVRLVGRDQVEAAARPGGQGFHFGRAGKMRE